MSEADRSFEAAWWVVDELVRFGMEHACVSPGSRSTPIALALWRHPSVRAHVHLDERAAAFFALGIAKATGRPVAVACTSGTAAAEFLPAVVEAWMSRTTLILLTADRPPELRGIGANQTIDQTGLYGSHVRGSFDAPVPSDATGVEMWRALMEPVTFTSMGPPPGPVHLNLPFREPLVPDPAALAPSPPARGPQGIVSGPEPEEMEALRDVFASTRRGLVLAGSMRETPESLVELARRLGWPLLAEPTSNLRVPGALSAGTHLLADEGFSAGHLPDVVVQFGAAPTSRAGLEFLRHARRLVIVDSDQAAADPNRAASWSLRADAWAVVAEVLDGLHPAGESGWLADWIRADAIARRVVDELIDSWDEPYEGRIARDVAALAPGGSTLVVGSSMPVRDLDAYLRPRVGLRVLANRGASGIDGFVSTALGVAASGVPTTALCGDLTLLHDVGSLLWSARRGYGAVFVVVNNAGGVIFRFLEQRELPEFEELFATPHGLDLGAVCAAARAGHVRVDRAGDLVPAVDRARETGGVQVVEVVVDPESNVRRHAEVHAAVADALRSNA